MCSHGPPLRPTSHTGGRRRIPGDDSEYARRQLNGLRALFALAEPETTVTPFSGTAVRLRSSGALEKLEGLDSQSPPADTKTASTRTVRRWTGSWHSVRSDQMLRSSLNLMLNSGVQAALGFGFWIIAARFFSTASVGRASTLISATSLISFFGFLGLNITFLRYLPVSRQRNRLITVGLVLVAGCSGGIALVYILLAPVFVRPISFVAHSLPLVAGFVILTAAASVNGLTDSVFIAAGKASYNTFIDGVIGGVTKIVLVVLLIGGGAYGVFCAATGGFMAAAIASLLLMVRVLHWRPQFGNFGQVLKPLVRFSGVNYAGSVLSMIPGLIVPLIVLNEIGASAAAYYYVSFQLASLLYAATVSVEQAFLTEGAHIGAINRAVLIRSARILLALCVPAFVIVILFAHKLLLAFGSSYSNNAASSLVPLAVAVFPIAADNWLLNVLRLSNQLKAIVWSNIVFAAVITGVAWVLAPRGLSAVAMAWPIGASAGALVAGVPAVRTIRRAGSSIHRPVPSKFGAS